MDARAGVTGYRLHDVRRSVATGLGELGVLPHIIEAILNHYSGHRSGVAGDARCATALGGSSRPNNKQLGNDAYVGVSYLNLALDQITKS